MFESEQDPPSRQNEIARWSEESRRRAEVPSDRPTSPGPMELEASAKKVVNTLGLGVVLFELIRNGLVGLVGVVFAPAFLWRWFSRPSAYGFLPGSIFNVRPGLRRLTKCLAGVATHWELRR